MSTSPLPQRHSPRCDQSKRVNYMCHSYQNI
eukprot:SAG25_NODE_12707_length_276_cov_0.598870_1_plen_30_part_10